MNILHVGITNPPFGWLIGMFVLRHCIVLRQSSTTVFCCFIFHFVQSDLLQPHVTLQMSSPTYIASTIMMAAIDHDVLDSSK